MVCGWVLQAVISDSVPKINVANSSIATFLENNIVPPFTLA
jgi:hypothetical protein